jgi:hypothetical protein
MVDAPATPRAPLGRETAPDLRMTILNCAVRSASRLPIRTWHLTCPFSRTADNNKQQSKSRDWPRRQSLTLGENEMEFLMFLFHTCMIVWGT